MTPTLSARTRAADEGGWILVTAISLLAIMLVMAFAALALVDTQQRRTGEQRQRESSLNLAETVLYQQGFRLAQRWPTAASPAIDCVTGSTDARCPDATQVILNSANTDTSSATTKWTTYVRDNGPPMDTAWRTPQMDAAQVTRDPATNAVLADCPGPCRHDANGDRKLWVMSHALVRGRTRTIVATMKLEQLAENVPQTAVVAGGINTGNNGSQIKIYAVGSQVLVRCSPSSSSCVTGSGIQPAPSRQPTSAPLMTASQIQRLKARAQADGTYHATCPSSGTVSGAVVFIEFCNESNYKFNFDNTNSATCDDALPPKPGGGGNGLTPDCINSMAKPGLLIVHCGRIRTSGKGTFVGVMYFVNGSDGACTPIGGSSPDCDGPVNDANNVFTTTGGMGILGAIAIDGTGCLYASSNGLQVQFDPNVFGAVTSYGTVGLVQDTWRELIPR